MTSPWGPSYENHEGGPVDPYAGQPAPLPPHNPYANPGSWEPARYLPRQSSPGTVLAGSIVAYVFAALLLVSGLFMLFFGSIMPSTFDGIDSTVGDTGTSLVLAGLGNWLAAALLVTGAVMCSMRRAAGLVVEVIAAALVVVLAVYWLALYPSSGIAVWAFVHVVVGLLATGLVVVPPVNRAWLAGADRALAGPAPAPPFPLDGHGRPFGS